MLCIIDIFWNYNKDESSEAIFFIHGHTVPRRDMGQALYSLSKGVFGCGTCGTLHPGLYRMYLLQRKHCHQVPIIQAWHTLLFVWICAKKHGADLIRFRAFKGTYNDVQFIDLNCHSCHLIYNANGKHEETFIKSEYNHTFLFLRVSFVVWQNCDFVETYFPVFLSSMSINIYFSYHCRSAGILAKGVVSYIYTTCTPSTQTRQFLISVVSAPGSILNAHFSLTEIINFRGINIQALTDNQS